MLTNKLKQFYQENSQGLYIYALSLTKNKENAEDIIHNVFLRILQKQKMPNNLKAYIYCSIRNRAIDLWRKSQKYNELSFEICEINQTKEIDNLTKEVAEKLKLLNHNEQEIILLKIYEDMTFKEISEIRNTSINTISSWYRRGIEKLKKILEEDIK